MKESLAAVVGLVLWVDVAAVFSGRVMLLVLRENLRCGGAGCPDDSDKIRAMKMPLERPGCNLYIVDQLCVFPSRPLASMLYSLLRSLLFLLPAEISHDWGLRGLKLLHKLGLSRLLAPQIPANPVRLLGLEFANPVGLAAGLDKNADYLDALGSLGFGFIEVGTVTPLAQPGNPKPRLFRLAGQRAIINRMGFNNKGLAHMLERLQQRRWKGVVGVNIGKNLTTPVERAADDYLTCLRAVYPLADYVVVNLSSPNTPGLRSLQFGEQLRNLLQTLKQAQAELQQQYQRRVPLLLKVAPDLSDEEIDGIAAVLLETQMEGVIVSNTTLSREGVEQAAEAGEAGGLSGAPLTQAATRVLGRMVAALNGSIPVIGVGGIMQGSDAADKLRAGASLVQIYSGFIYAGPALIAAAARACEQVGPRG
jgi:dihydroorotate dehydrogenase